MSRAEVQAELNGHPNASPFWDSDRGQEVLEAAKAYGIKAQNSNKDRARIYAVAGIRRYG
jgi:hypothetical protein